MVNNRSARGSGICENVGPGFNEIRIRGVGWGVRRERREEPLKFANCGQEFVCRIRRWLTSWTCGPGPRKTRSQQLPELEFVLFPRTATGINAVNKIEGGSKSGIRICPLN